PPVVLDHAGCRLLLEHGNRVTKMLQPRLLQFIDRVVARVIAFRLGGNDLVEQFAGAVVLAGLDVRLRHRNRLTETSASLRGHHDDAGARWSLQDERPLLWRETGLIRHVLLPLVWLLGPPHEATDTSDAECRANFDAGTSRTCAGTA